MKILKSINSGLMFQFDGSADVISYCDPAKWSASSSEKDFVGDDFKTFEDAKQKTESAWMYGMDVLAAFVEQLYGAKIPELKSHIRKVEYSAGGGDEIDYERLMEGRADFFRKAVREESAGVSTVTIFIDTTTPAHMMTDDVLWRGAAAIALAKLLEEKGYATELWVVNGSCLFSGENTRVMTSCCLKRCSEPLDVSTLVNTVSGWCYRSVTFTLLYTICTRIGKSVAYGLGQCSTPTQADLDLLSSDGNRVYAAGVFSFSAALGVVQAEIAKMAPSNQV